MMEIMKFVCTERADRFIGRQALVDQSQQSPFIKDQFEAVLLLKAAGKSQNLGPEDFLLLEGIRL